MTHDEEEKKLFLTYLQDHVFNSWLHEDATYSISLEFIVSSVCNTKCSYCYYKNYRDQIYPASLCGKENILKNCRKIINWINACNYKINTFEIFSGEFFKLPYYEEILEIMNGYKYHVNVTIPSNCTFSYSEKETQKVEEILNKYKKSNLNIHISTSIDGKFLDNTTRAMRNGNQYTDEMYDRLFKFAAKHHYPFHPMISANSIKYWKENFDWFLEMIQKYFKVSKKEALSWVYLLEVRNPDWKEEDLKYMAEFSEYLTDVSFKAYNENITDYVDNFIYGSSSLNYYSSLTNTIGRGLGCGIQQAFAIRLGDLKLVPCHRTSYDGFNACNLIIDDDHPEKLDIKLENPHIWMLANSFDVHGAPGCNDCPISELCSHFCLGCNYEVNKDFFTPVPNVCKMERVKQVSLIKALDKRGILDAILAKQPQSFTPGNYAFKKWSQIRKIQELVRR